MTVIVEDHGRPLIEVGDRRQSIVEMEDGRLWDEATFRDWVAANNPKPRAVVVRLSESDAMCLALAAGASGDRGKGGEL